MMNTTNMCDNASSTETVRVIPLITDRSEMKETRDPSEKAYESLELAILNLAPTIPLISNTPNVGNHLTLGGNFEEEHEKNGMLLNSPYLESYEKIETEYSECKNAEDEEGENETNIVNPNHIEPSQQHNDNGRNSCTCFGCKEKGIDEVFECGNPNCNRCMHFVCYQFMCNKYNLQLPPQPFLACTKG